MNFASIKSRIRQALHADVPTTGNFVPYVRRFNVFGTEFDFWIADQTSKAWYDHDFWNDAPEFQMLDRMIGNDSRVLEVGLHHGFTSTFISRKVHARGKYVGVELVPIASLYAMANLKLNGLGENCLVVNAAGGAQPGMVSFSNSPDANGQVTNDGRGVPIRQITGDSLLPELGDGIDCLKIDVEGFEVDVLEGCREILAQHPNIAIELHLDLIGRYGRSAGRIFELIDLDRYTASCFWNPGTQYSDPTSHGISPFTRGQLPTSGILNLFLVAKPGGSLTPRPDASNGSPVQV